MKTYFFFIPGIFLSAMLISCSDKAKDKKTENSAEAPVVEAKDTVAQQPSPEFVKQTANDNTAQQVKDYIVTKMLLPNDLNVIPSSDRKFQIYETDLNKDGKNEVFVNFMTPYFCGSGGCTVLVLHNDITPITKFTVTRVPIYAEQTEKNGWRILLNKSGDEWKELVYKDGKYPSNPSVVAKASVAAPGSDAEIIFDTAKTAKTYDF